MAVGAILGVSFVTYGAATLLLGVLDKATVALVSQTESPGSGAARASWASTVQVRRAALGNDRQCLIKHKVLSHDSPSTLSLLRLRYTDVRNTSSIEVSPASTFRHPSSRSDTMPCSSAASRRLMCSAPRRPSQWRTVHRLLI